MSYKTINRKLETGDIIILDGANGSELERRGVPMDPKAWCGIASVEHLGILEEIHLDYIKAGADIITTHTYASNRLMLKSVQLEDKVVEINQAAIEVAKTAIKKSGRKVALAGSMSHRVPEFDDEAKAPSVHEAEEALDEMASILSKQNCDFILLEMMYHPVRTSLAFKSAIRTGLPVWAGFSARRGKNGEILNYFSSEDIPFEETVRILEDFDVDAAGIMHTPSNVVEDALEILKEVYNGPLFAYPDSGYFLSPNWQFKDTIEPLDLKEFGQNWIDNGVQVLGGCCGLSPHHIKALAELKPN
tara:strand:- start:3319 stop:4227 length:909 start_codon:yes stop_codon:yes gene_type:complete